jgi:N-methylhydantoinase A/acetone carboxylase, beta subunit
MRTKYRLGIDAGGTFTDLVLADQSGDVRLYKALSTPADPTRAIEEGMKLIADDLGESPAKSSRIRTSALTARRSGSTP